jgi:thioredoxin:protein disulfide reductase
MRRRKYGAGRDRTGDLTNAIRALYLLSYSPTKKSIQKKGVKRILILRNVTQNCKNYQKGKEMVKKALLLSGCLSVFLFSIIVPVQAKTIVSSEHIGDNNRKILLKLKLAPKDFVLRESIDISADHPNIKLSSWQIDRPVVERYIPTFKETKKILDGDFIISLRATSNKPFSQIKGAHLYLSYYANSKKGTIQEVLPLKDVVAIEPTISQPGDKIEKVIPTIEPDRPKKKDVTWSEYLSDVVTKTENIWIRILLVLLLGLLMSLTPCIYPMIPITLGILQSRGSTSVAYNFLQALLYTCGIATTFAILGLIAAFTGQVFGTIMTSPIFIIILSTLLAYLGLSMFGFYEMYTPKFMRSGANARSVKKSLFSTFLFGAASGSVASPCLSPGLILLLSIVTALGNKFLGFILLFSFGFGLGIPLLILGMFSSSLNALPRAGMWMIEVKKIFGFMLFGMAFYFLSALVPLSILFACATLFMLAASAFYFYSITPQDSSGIKTIKNIIGVLCAILTVFLAFQTYKSLFWKDLIPSDAFWYKNPQQALAVAKKEKKRVFIDIGGQFCSICKTIDRTLLSDRRVRAALNKFINLKIDGNNCPKETFKGLCSKYEVVGFPTFLIIEPDSGDLVARWGSELYGLPPDQFIKMLENY